MSAWGIVSAISYWAVMAAFVYLMVGVVVTLLLLLRWYLLRDRHATVFSPFIIYRMLPNLLFVWPVSVYVVVRSMLLSYRVRRAMSRLERRYGRN